MKWKRGSLAGWPSQSQTEEETMRKPRLTNKPQKMQGSFIGCLLLAGCGNLSGLGGSEHYGCKAPVGVQCESVSGNYYNSVRGTSRLPAVESGPGTLKPAGLNKVALTGYGTPASGGTDELSGYAPIPLRSPPRVLRLWVKAWEDADHDLVDQSYVYVRIDQGKWQLDHVQRQVREAYAPLRPPAKDAAVSAQAPTGAVPGLPGNSSLGTASPLPSLESAASGSAIGAR
jgi:conjugal transfer pilus assembly protein TraV